MAPCACSMRSMDQSGRAVTWRAERRAQQRLHPRTARELCDAEKRELPVELRCELPICRFKIATRVLAGMPQ